MEINTEKLLEGGQAEMALRPMPGTFEDEENLYRVVMSMLSFGTAQQVDTLMYNKLIVSPHLANTVFSNPKSDDDPHTKDITLLHLACQEGFHRSAKYINQLDSSLIFG